MSRYIDACKFAKKAYDVAYPIVYDRNSHERGLSLMGIAQLLDEQPEVDLVEVVRCKDCKYADWYKNGNNTMSANCLDGNGIGKTERDFCSRGEREYG